MQTDFYDAHIRHWDDAERLFGVSRWANADHLYGMAVECGLKRLMIAFGMPIATDGGPAQQSDRVHANQAWDRYEAYRSGHVAGASYGLPMANPFLDWEVSQRYAHQSNFDQARATGHRTGAEEEQPESALGGLPSFTLDGLDDIYVVDRLATESNWASIAPPTTGAPRIVFFSIKGGVGRSTALAASAWALAQQGKRVLVLDLDLESPGLSSALLPDERRLDYGIADWLVEDLVDNGDPVFEQMVAISTLSRDGEIYVVPAYGRDPGEYVAKLGRVWMPKVSSEGVRESWSRRLQRLIGALEARWQPNVILIDSRAGIDEVASACVTDLGANLVLLFAVDGEQTWAGYRILFRHWRTGTVARDIRERLQLVGALIPEDDRLTYLEGLRERAWDVFAEELYDLVPPGAVADDLWSFDTADEAAPHAPWAVRWHRGWAAVRSLHGRIEGVDATEIDTIFGPLISGIGTVVE